MLTIKEFLTSVITSEEPGWFCLALAVGGKWLEEWHRWPGDLDRICERAAAQAAASNVYFSSYLFKAPNSLRENVLPTRTIQADLDDADISVLPREPTILVETSPGRHQGYWILAKATDTLEEHETISKKLTYSIPLCDRSGWPLGRKVRIPGTLNHKYLDGAKQVKVVKATKQKYHAEEFESLPEVPQHVVEHYDNDFIEKPTGVDDHPLELLASIKDVVPTSVYVRYSMAQPDRSEALWSLMCFAFKAGLSRSQVFTLAQGSANNKFADLRHRADQDLAKDVLRAEHAVNTNIQDERQLVRDIHKKAPNSYDRKRQIFDAVLAALKAQGEFFHTNIGTYFYVRKDIGRPIHISEHSDYLKALLDLQFGLNATEAESSYVTAALVSYCSGLPDTAIHAALSYVLPEQNTMLLHTGRRIVLKITPDTVEHITDGAYRVIFQWAPGVESFMPARYPSGLDWGDELFGDGRRGFGSSVRNVTNMTPNQSRALLKVWTLFVLFRSMAPTRPIIAAFGTQGSGKSTLFKKVYALFYGSQKSVSGITSVDDFDHSVAADPLYVIDNVDTWERWLPDRIALCAGTSDIIKRKLWTDADTITMKRQAMVGVTAHNPKFGREDVADRLLLFAYRRLTHFIDEGTIMRDVLESRNELWGAIVKDIQAVLRTPMPANHEVPQFRIEDFAKIGLWIARAIGEEDDFRTAIEDVKTAAHAFTLEEDSMLVQAVQKMANRPDSQKYYTASQVWAILEACADDSRAFDHAYRNPVYLGKKLLSMSPSLGKVVDISQKPGEGGVRTWKITQKEAIHGGD